MDSAHRSGPYEKIPPVPGTNQIAGFVGFHPLTSRKKDNDIYLFIPGAIIRDNFLFLEQIAPSPVAHAHTCCTRIFTCVAQAKRHSKLFMLLAHNSLSLWLLAFCLSIFVVSCSSFECIIRKVMNSGLKITADNVRPR